MNTKKGGLRPGYHHAKLMKGRTKSKHHRYRAEALNGSDETALAAQIESFLDWRKTRNYTERTLEGTRVSLRFFVLWANERTLSDAAEITRPILESFQQHLYRHRKPNGQPLGFSTQRNRLTALRDFFSWMCRQHYLKANPASDLEMPRAQKRLLHRAMTHEEIAAVMNVPDINDPLGLRDRAILELLYSCGLRRGEVTDLRIEEIDFEKRTLFVNLGKGQKDRYTPVGERALKWVRTYMEKARPELVLSLSDRTLFISSYGEAMSRNSLGNRIKKLLLAADIKKTGGCHLFRHTCGTHLLEGGADIRYIQQILGHARLDTTAVYTQVSIEQLVQVHAQCHPAAKG